MRKFFSWFTGLPARIYRGMLSLNDAEQKALMTWGMLGGIVVLTGLLIWIITIADAHFPREGMETLALAIANGLFILAYAVTALIGLFAFGIVAIAYAGSLRFKHKDTEIEAGGSAAKQLARETDITNIKN